MGTRAALQTRRSQLPKVLVQRARRRPAEREVAEADSREGDERKVDAVDAGPAVLSLREWRDDANHHDGDHEKEEGAGGLELGACTLGAVINEELKPVRKQGRERWSTVRACMCMR